MKEKFKIFVIVLISLYFIYIIINFSKAFIRADLEKDKALDEKIYLTYRNQEENFIINKLGLPNSIYTIANKKVLNYEVLDENNNDGAIFNFDGKGNFSVSQVPINCSIKLIFESNVLSKVENINCSSSAFYNFFK